MWSVATTFRPTATHSRHDRRLDSRTNDVNAHWPHATRQPNQNAMTGELTGESIHQQLGSSRDTLCRVRALCPRFVLRKKLGSGPLLRALPRDPGKQPGRASLDFRIRTLLCQYCSHSQGAATFNGAKSQCDNEASLRYTRFSKSTFLCFYVVIAHPG